MVAASGSHSSSAVASRPGIQSNRYTTATASSEARPETKKSLAASAAYTNDPTTDRTAGPAARGSPRRRPAKWFSSAAPSGRAITIHR